MLEDMDWDDKTHNIGQQMLDVVREEHANKAFITPYNIIETLGGIYDADDDTEVYVPEVQVQNEEYEPSWIKITS